jgi:hypothetical protein
LICCIFIAGCSTPVQQVGVDTPPIILKEPQTRKLSPAGTVSVPAGIYKPDFEASNGIYYHAPTHLIVRILGLNSVQRGGIFIPNQPTEEQKEEMEAEKAKPKSPQDHTISSTPTESDFQMGIWEDQQEGSGGLFAYALTSPKRIFRVTEPFIYEAGTNQP